MKYFRKYFQNNFWRKRGLTMSAVKYCMQWFPPGLSTHVSVFCGDGTVTVMTSGVEMGQGLYTKVTRMTRSSHHQTRKTQLLLQIFPQSFNSCEFEVTDLKLKPVSCREFVVRKITLDLNIEGLFKRFVSYPSHCGVNKSSL